MRKQRKYVVAFLGRRDGYQVPLALQEVGRLERFVTGIYKKGWRSTLLGRLSNRFNAPLQMRRCEGLDARNVESRWSIEVIQKLSRFAGDQTNRSWRWADKIVSIAARDIARKTKADLFLYEPYAFEAFKADYLHEPRKVLFHFHLQPQFERDLLALDNERYPLSGKPWLQIDAKPNDGERVNQASELADLVVCASSFTKRSLVSQGMPPDKGVVVPYGILVPKMAEPTSVPNEFKAIFVGSAIQRKGVHHLLSAWLAADLPKNASLTLICRFVDPALEPLLENAGDRVHVLRGVSSPQLSSLYRSSSLMVLPSLLEGFGQVFLEALSQGCPVLGTPNSCLPDLGSEHEGVFVVEAGNVNALRERIEQLAHTLIESEAIFIRARAVEVARRHTWPLFRSKLIHAIDKGFMDR